MDRKMYLWIFVGVVSFMLLAAPLGYARDATQEQDPQEDAQKDMGDSALMPGGADAMSTGADPEAVFFINDATSSDNLNNPDIDVWRVRCTHNTTICAAVADDTFLDNTFHVTVLCVDPLSRRGRGEKEYASAGAPDFRNPSDSACVSSCREALVVFECERSDFCDSFYDAAIECVNRNFQFFPQLRQ